MCRRQPGEKKPDEPAQVTDHPEARVSKSYTTKPGPLLAPSGIDRGLKRVRNAEKTKAKP